MSLSQTIIITLILSLPIVTLIAIVRGALCVFRSHKAKRVKFVILSSLSIILMLGILAFVAIVLFIYGVAHTGKDISTDLLVLASTAIPIYAGAYGIWLLCKYIEKKLRNNIA